MSTFPLPGPTHRTAVLGRTGSGKTQFAVWLLGRQDLRARPWLIIDYKYDRLIQRLKAQEVDFNWKPKRQGLYIIHPRPDEDDLVEELLWRIWERGNCGLYIDEGHLVPNMGAFASLLVTGRSKRIPMIVLSQRPVLVPRFVFTEASFLSVFPLNDRRDQLTVQAFSPIDMKYDLPRYHSWWYDVEQNRRYIMKPVPEANALVEDIEDQVKERRSIWSILSLS